MKRQHLVVAAVLLLIGLLAADASAQNTAEASSDLPDRFQVDVGYFHITADTTLRFGGVQGSSDVVFEKDLGIPSDASTFWVDVTARLTRRNALKLNYTRLDRDRAGFTLQRNFTWGGQTYNAGLSSTASTATDLLTGYYRFSVVRNERFEVGPTVGFGWLWLQAGIQATGTLGAQTRTIDESQTTGSPTAAVGGFANVWPAKRLAVRADFLYFKANIQDADASITDWRIGADYYFVRNAGVGVQYKYNKYTYDRGVLSTSLGGQISYKGFQVFASLLF